MPSAAWGLVCPLKRRREALFELSGKDAYRVMLKEYPDVMNVDQLCEILGVSKKTGYKLLQTNAIPNRKVGRAYRVAKIHLIAYLRASGT